MHGVLSRKLCLYNKLRSINQCIRTSSDTAEYELYISEMIVDLGQTVDGIIRAVKLAKHNAILKLEQEKGILFVINSIRTRSAYYFTAHTHIKRNKMENYTSLY
jgi:hypothetical protein